MEFETTIENHYDIPTPTRVTPWGIEEKKAVNPKGWRDPFGYVDRKPGARTSSGRVPNNAKGIIVTFPGGEEFRYTSVTAAASELFMTPNTVRAMMHREVKGYPGHRARWADA